MMVVVGLVVVVVVGGTVVVEAAAVVGIGIVGLGGNESSSANRAQDVPPNPRATSKTNVPHDKQGPPEGGRTTPPLFVGKVRTDHLSKGALIELKLLPKGVPAEDWVVAA